MKTKHSITRIKQILDEHRQGATCPELCEKYGISDSTFYKYRRTHGNGRADGVLARKRMRGKQIHRTITKTKPVDNTSLNRTNALIEENRRLKELLMSAWTEMAE